MTRTNAVLTNGDNNEDAASNEPIRQRPTVLRKRSFKASVVLDELRKTLLRLGVLWRLAQRRRASSRQRLEAFLGKAVATLESELPGLAALSDEDLNLAIRQAAAEAVWHTPSLYAPARPRSREGLLVAAKATLDFMAGVTNELGAAIYWERERLSERGTVNSDRVAGALSAFERDFGRALPDLKKKARWLEDDAASIGAPRVASAQT